MKTFLVNFAILFGAIGFAGFLFVIIASFFGCCAHVTTLFFHRLIIIFFAIATVLFGICMYNNCCHLLKGKN